jgi:hypothetical protein
MALLGGGKNKAVSLIWKKYVTGACLIPCLFLQWFLLPAAMNWAAVLLSVIRPHHTLKPCSQMTTV